MSCIIDIYILQFPAADIARECRQFSKQDNERSASLMKLKEIRSENAAQHLARIGQFLSAETTDSKDQASDVNAIQLPENPVR